MKKNFLCLLFCCFIFMLAGCAKLPSSSNSTDSSSSQVKQFIDDSGFTLVFTKTPKRVVSLAPSLTEIVGAIGQTEKLIAVSRYSDYPEAVKKIPKAGSYVRPNTEAIVAMNPDLVMVVKEGPPKDSIEKLRSLGIQVAVLDSVDFGGVMKNVRWIADVFDCSTTGERVATDLERKYNAIQELVAELPKEKVLYAISLQPVITVGSRSFIHSIIEDAGATNVAGDIRESYPRLTLESVIAREPEIIFFSGGMGSEARAKTMRTYWRRWSQIPAVKKKRLLEIDTNRINRAGPRIVEALAMVASKFHPEKAEDIRKLMEQ